MTPESSLSTAQNSILAGEQTGNRAAIERNRGIQGCIYAKSHEDVIVAKYIQSEAIVGSMLISTLEVIIPSWVSEAA